MCSLTFLYLFLPASVLICRMLPPRARNWFLLVISTLFYYWVEGDYLLLAVSVVGFDYTMGRLLESSRAFPVLRRAVLFCSVAKSAALILFYGVAAQVWAETIPLGLGILCLTSCGYVIDCFNGSTAYEHNLADFALFNLFFPKLYAGPVITHNKMSAPMRSMRMTWEKAGQGGGLFLRGLASIVVVGNTVFGVYREIKATPTYNLMPLSVWVMVVTYALSLYFFLSGYSAMAKGIGLLFGFELPDNFNYPFRSTSINEFFTRFNITINRFFRRYVYFTLGGAQGGIASGVFNILLVTILMGLWFGISLNLLAWGLYFALFVIFERYVLSRFLDAIPTLFRWLYCTTAVFISFVFFVGNSLAQSVDYLEKMLGFSGAAAFDSNLLYLLASNYLILLIAVAGATGLFNWVASLCRKALPGIWGIASLLFHAGLLLVVTAFLL